MKQYALAVLATALVGCAAPWADDGTTESTGLDRSLAGEATEQTTPATESSEPVGSPSDPGSAGGGAATGSGPGTRPTGPGSGGSAPTRRLGQQPDGAGDAGVGAPGYADLVDVELVDTGSSFRATISMAGAIPRALRDREAAGIGVDLYVTGVGTESDYQIFLEGSSEGWFAYLETPSGLAQFVGTFELAADRFIVSVPWSALDNLRSGRFAVFADASSAVLAVAVSSEDHAPNTETAPFG